METLELKEVYQSKSVSVTTPINEESAIFGLTSAISWGAGDFSRGIVTKTLSAKSIVIFSQIGLVHLIFFLLIIN